MSRIHELIIIPGAGHCGQGTYDRGHVQGNLAEVDLVDKYVQTMLDELDNSGIRHRVINTRKAPGTPIDERYKICLDESMPILCTVGIHPAKKKMQSTNVSCVRYGPRISQSLIEDLNDVVGHWGGLYVHGHRTGCPVPMGAPGLMIEPFQLNGPDVMEYARFIDKLGRDIGVFLADYLKACKQDAAIALPSLTNSKLRAM